MLILQTLSQGEDLSNVGKKLSLEDYLVVELLNDTIARLTASVSGNKKPSSILPLEIPERKILGERNSVESVIGLGGMGIVYKGRHVLMDRPVAIKMLHNEYTLDALVVKRFLSEAKTLSSLSHSNLVAVFDFGVTPQDEPFVVMEYHDGKGLDDILESETTFCTDGAINIFGQVCDAMTAVHQQDIVHRDIKPSNIIIAENGLVKLVDFGIAQTIASKALNLTMSGEIVGTPKYMSPEQCKGEILDARSDIYSLGCVMYQIFTGQAPFDADSFYEMAQKHLETIPSTLPFEKLSSQISPDLESIIFQTLEKEPGKRYPTAAALKKDLLSALKV